MFVAAAVQADQISGRGAAFTESVRQRRGAAVELAVGKPPVAGDHGNRFGRRSGLTGDHRFDPLPAWVIERRIIEALQQLLVTGGRRECLGDRTTWPGDHAAQAFAVEIEPAPDRCGVEERSAVLCLEDDLVLVLAGVEEQLEVLVTPRIAAQMHAQAGRRQLLAADRRVEIEQHRNERQATGIALDRQGLEQTAEGAGLVFVGVEDPLARGGEQVDEGTVDLDGDPDRQQLHAVTDQSEAPFGRLPGSRNPDHEVVLPGQTGEQCPVDGEQRDEQAGAVLRNRSA